MLNEQIRRAVLAASRIALPDVAAVMWKAFGSGLITEAEAGELSDLIEARKALPPAPKPVRVRTGSRPRSPASMERRRSWSSSGRLPPAVSCRFTPGEAAVMAVVAVEVRRSGDCRWPLAKLAAISGTSESTVKRAIRAARDLGLISVEERRLSAFRSDTNVLRIVCTTWLAWLSRGGGGQTWPPKTTKGFQGGRETTGTGSKGMRGEARSEARAGMPHCRVRERP